MKAESSLAVADLQFYLDANGLRCVRQINGEPLGVFSFNPKVTSALISWLSRKDLNGLTTNEVVEKLTI